MPSDMPLDSTTIERDGIRYRVSIYRDEDSSPEDDEGLSPSDKKAFRDGLWRYVGVVVTPELGTQIDASGMHDSIWRVQYGVLPAETSEWQGGKHGEIVIGMDYIVNTHPVPDMIGEVRENMRQMGVKLASLGLAG
ncbi:MAG TPA: hypothetical protein VF933_17760 [Streptosporangiaceae bacterium]